MTTSQRGDVRSAMARLADARPPVADRTEGIVPRAERARLLASIVATADAPSPGAGRGPEPVPVPAPLDPSPRSPRSPTSADHQPPRRRALAGALVAAVVAAGLGVAGVVGPGEDAAQVTAGPGPDESPARPALAADPPATTFAPTGLPAGMVLQGVEVEPDVPPLPGSPFIDVFGLVAGDGTVAEAVAVISATAPDVLDALLGGSGATTSPVPGEPGSLHIDLGQGLVARSFTLGGAEPRTVCGTGGCVEIVDQLDQALTVVVLGRGLDGHPDLPGAVHELVLRPDAAVPGDRVEAPALLARGYRQIYEGDQVPGLATGERTVLRYGDEGGGREVTLRLQDGHTFDPASVAWQFAESRLVEVRGHEGLLVADDLLTSVTWQERQGLTLSLDVNGFSEDEALAMANRVEQVSDAPWLPVTGDAGESPSQPGPSQPGPSQPQATPAPGPGPGPDSVISNGGQGSGPEVVLSEGQAGDQRWQLVGYEVAAGPGEEGADVCVELRGTSAAAGGCLPGAALEGSPGDGPALALGAGPELGGHVMFRGAVSPSVATVRFLFDDGGSLDVATVSHERFGTHVVAAMPLDADGATVVLLDEDGVELQRQEHSFL